MTLVINCMLCALCLYVFCFVRACVLHLNTPFHRVSMSTNVRHVARAEWIEEHSSAAAPLANYAPNHLETYRDTQVPPTLPPGPAGPKSKYFSSSDASCSSVKA